MLVVVGGVFAIL